jgi:hypothetical protein
MRQQQQLPEVAVAWLGGHSCCCCRVTRRQQQLLGQVATATAPRDRSSMAVRMHLLLLSRDPATTATALRQCNSGQDLRFNSKRGGTSLPFRTKSVMILRRLRFTEISPEVYSKRSLRHCFEYKERRNLRFTESLFYRYRLCSKRENVYPRFELKRRSWTAPVRKVSRCYLLAS